MLSKEAQKKLLKALGVPEAEINTIVDTDEEKDASVPDGVKIFNQADLQETLDNYHNSKKSAMKEIFVKDLKAAAGLDFEGKTTEKFLEAYKTHVLAEAGQSVDEKVKGKDTKIAELQAKLTEKDTAITKLTADLDAAAFDAELLTAFPKERDPRLSDKDYLTLLKARITVGDEDGKRVLSLGDKKLRDDKLNPLPVSEAIPSVFKEQNWLAAADDDKSKEALGGGDNGGGAGTFGSMAEVKKHLEAKGINPLGEEGMAIVRDAADKNPNFVFN